MPKVFTAKSSDLAGATNPTGIWSPAFLSLKLALDNGESPANVKQALYDWLSQKGIKTGQVDALLDMEPQAALAALIQKIGAGLKQETLPPDVISTLRRTLASIAQTYSEKQSAELANQQKRLDRIKAAFVEGQAPQTVVKKLLS